MTTYRYQRTVIIEQTFDDAETDGLPPDEGDLSNWRRDLEDAPEYLGEFISISDAALSDPKEEQNND